MRKRSLGIIAAVLLAVAATAGAAAQAPTVSEKQEIAIFALGFYGWNIPWETLGGIDAEIQKVFADLGRFTVIGYGQRLTSGGIEQFIDALRRAKEAGFVMPERFQFGEALLTEAEFNRLVGSFIVAAPVVTRFESIWNQKTGYWETTLETKTSFLDVAAGGALLAVAEVRSSGSDKTSQLRSIADAIDGIPAQLQFEIRKIPAFQISTRILAVSGAEVKLQLGRNMGIMKGDEYAVVVSGTVEGFRDDRETGLVLIKEVGEEVSTGLVLYNQGKLAKDAQLREIPRLGADFQPYLRFLVGQKLDVPLDSSGAGPLNLVIGARFPLSRGFFDVRPFGAVQIPLNGIRNVLSAFAIPINALVGAEYNLYLGPLALSPYGAVGGSYVYLTEAVSGNSRDTSDTYVFHVGAQAGAALSLLVGRDLRIYAEVGAEYWLSLVTWLYTNYGGVSAGAGVVLKL